MSSNKDYLAFFHKLHCILRDGEIGLTGLNALNEINNMVLILFMEQYVDTYDMDESNKFSYIYNKYVIPYMVEKTLTEKNKKLDKILSKYNDVLTNLYKNENTKRYIFSDTNKISAFHSISNKGVDVDLNTYFGAAKQLAELFIASRVFFYGTSDKESKDEMKISEQIVKEVMNKIDYDILGDAYEKFKEDEVGNQGKNTGQYFTPRPVIGFIVESLVKPKATELCYDSSCGTGGFFHYLNKYVHSNSSAKAHEKFKSNMYGNDKTPEIMKPLYINLFLHGIPVDNITNRNSVSQTNCWEQFERFDCVVGNPPFGMSIKSDPQDYVNEFNKCKYNYWPKCMIAKKNETVKDSMGQFMVHTINSLKVGGRFGLVIDRGILNNGTENNSWQKKLRQWILTVCDFQTIILLPKGIFTHTQFDTAIIYGVKKIGYVDSTDNMYKPSTNVVKVYEAKFVDEKSKTGIKVDLAQPDLELTIKQIVNKDWSLKYDDYVERKEETYKGIQYKTLGEVCKYNIGGTPATKEPKYWNGTNLWVSISDLDENIIKDTERKITDLGIEKSSVKLIPKNTLLYSFKLTVGKTGITGNEMYCNEAIVFFTSLEDISQEYLRIYLKLLSFEKIKHLSNSQIGESLNKSTIGQIKIPILPADHQARIVQFMDTYIGSDYKILDRLVSEFKDIDLFKFLLYEDYDTFEVMIKMARDIDDYETNGKKRFNTRRRWCFSMVPGKTMTLGELVEISGGVKFKLSKQPISTPSKIAYLRGGDLNEYKTTDFNGVYFDYEDKKFNDFTINYGDIYYTLVGTVGICGEYLYNHKTIISGNLCRIYNCKINKKYLINYLVQNKPKTNNNAQPNISRGTLEKIKIPVPSAEDQEKVVKMIDEINKEEGEFSNQVKALKESIIKLYQCVEQLVNTNVSNLNQEADQTIDQQAESDDESEQEQLDDESESESDEEPVEIEIKKKPYIRIGTNIYVKTEKGRGELYGTWNASTNKFTKVTKEFNV